MFGSDICCRILKVVEWSVLEGIVVVSCNYGERKVPLLDPGWGSMQRPEPYVRDSRDEASCFAFVGQ